MVGSRRKLGGSMKEGIGMSAGSGGGFLGINGAYHETSACLVIGDRIVAAAEEERFNRIKHGKCATIENANLLPWHAIDFCLHQGGIAFDDLEGVGYSIEPEARWEANHESGTLETSGRRSWGGHAGERVYRDLTMTVPNLLERVHGCDLDGRFHFLSHHLCHLASAYHPSPFASAALLSLDGIGEWESTALARGEGGEIEVLHRHGFPDSLGFLWEKITAYLGFRKNHDECRVMGLAAYGDPSRHREAFARLVTRDGEGGFAMDDSLLRFRDEDGFEGLEALLGPRRHGHERLCWQGGDRRHADVAAALQERTEEVIVDLGRDLARRTGLSRLALAGGVALNCVANARLHREGIFEDIWVQPAANDAGTAIGAACLLARRSGRRFVGEAQAGPYLGPSFDVDRVDEAIRSFGMGDAVMTIPEAENLDWVAEQLKRGEVVAWFQGAMEFGPRALGNRSILADPRREEMRDVLNRKVKHRELFRPFCPSVLAERADDWFEVGSKPPSASDYMLMALPIRPERRQAIPAVSHVDGTSRIQRVHREQTPLYHALISAFAEKTGVPLLLNTSFNDREPIVCSPEDALRCFLKTSIDVLVLGSRILKKGDPS